MVKPEAEEASKAIFQLEAEKTASQAKTKADKVALQATPKREANEASTVKSQE